jgi:hypothetical protein
LFGYACYYYYKPANSVTSFDGVGGTLITGAGCLIIGAVLTLIWRAYRPAYFRGEVLNKQTPVLVPERDDVQLAIAAELAGVQLATPEETRP